MAVHEWKPDPDGVRVTGRLVDTSEGFAPVADDIVTRLLALNHPDAADAADEIERLRDASEWLKQALLVTSNWWGQHHTTEADAKYHNMVDAAIDRYKEARRG